MNKKCYECGKQICDHGVTMPGIPASFCSIGCYNKHVDDCYNLAKEKKENKDA